jgi:hypothetical protein
VVLRVIQCKKRAKSAFFTLQTPQNEPKNGIFAAILIQKFTSATGS